MIIVEDKIRIKHLYTFFIGLCIFKICFTEVEINFLIVGHIKFSVDRHFGYGKYNLKNQ